MTKPESIATILDNAPEVSFDRLVDTSLLLLQHYIFEEQKDYMRNPSVDHIFLEWMVLLKWARGLRSKPEVH